MPAPVAVKHVQFGHGSFQIEAMRGQYLRIGSRIHPAQPLRPVDTAIVGYLAAAERTGPVKKYRWARN
jgi:hypothetical protein